LARRRVEGVKIGDLFHIFFSLKCQPSAIERAICCAEAALRV
jgi:hypothetical protein